MYVHLAGTFLYSDVQEFEPAVKFCTTELYPVLHCFQRSVLVACGVLSLTVGLSPLSRLWVSGSHGRV